MKKFIIITSALSILFAFSTYAQSNTEKEDLVKAQKIAFFTEKLNLTPDEAQNFWPVYNSYWEKKNVIIEERKKAMQYCAENMSKMSEKEIERYGDMYINFHKQESDLLVEYNKKFKQILSPEKIMKLYQADYDFKTYLLRQIRNSSSKEE
ncbi:MAG TPA: hypothetical protein PLV65_02780 [Tenuifilaceae bacterium]|nr:hypothetical protein [Tenuifilaceae bacterium]